MNRKDFFSLVGVATLSASPVLGSSIYSADRGFRGVKIPPYLKPGDAIGICSPASYIAIEEIQPSVKLIQEWGFKVVIGKSVGQKDFSLGGTDEVRRADFQEMLDDTSIKAIMCARGGYGVVRMIDSINFKFFRKHPKWVIGFSDITLLHTHINSKFGIASIHSKMCNSFPADWNLATPMQIETILSIRQVLSGDPVKYVAAPSPYNRYGNIQGVVVGGNLSMIETASGTDSDLDTSGKILFLEDTQEELYSIDRMLWNIKRSGKLDRLKGLIIGGFKIKLETPGNEFGKTVYELVSEKVKEFNYPVCFDFPVGHQVNNYAIKSGTPHILNVDSSGSSITSIL
ncbi:S66 peptidase family protein [Pedobacter sp. PWIIR3]